MDLDREAWAWGKKMKPIFEAADKDFAKGFELGVLIFIGICIVALLIAAL